MEKDYTNYNPLKRFLNKQNMLYEESNELWDNIRVSVKEDMYLYNYTDAVLVPRNHPVIVLCRGLVLDEDGNVKCFPMKRSFNHFEKECATIDWNSAVVQEKVDGCVDGKSRILIQGKYREVPVTSLFGARKNWVGKKILSLNQGEIVFSEVLGVSRKELTKKWLNINIKGSNLNCTADHKILTPNGWVEADNLKIDDEVYTYLRRPTYLLQQCLIGTLLGDGNIQKIGNNYKIAISQKEEEYVTFKEYILKPFGFYRDIRISGYGTKMFRVASHTNDYLTGLSKHFWNENHKRYFSDFCFNELDWLSLCIWYMDDGSLSHNIKQRDRVRLDITRYSDDDALKIKECLFKRFGITSSVIHYKQKYKSISFNTNSSQLFFRNIAKFVPTYMSRKIPSNMQHLIGTDVDIKNWDIRMVPVLELNKITHKSDDVVGHRMDYDIQTETGNFFANGILVHNSLINVFKPKDTWEVTTRGGFYEDNEPNGNNVNFKDLFKSNFNKFELLNPELCYSMELCTDKNRIVTWYDKPSVTLLLARNLKTLEEVNSQELDVIAKQIGVDRPNQFSAKNVEQSKALFSTLKQDDEGFVVVDKNFNRIKLKQQSYLKLSKIKQLSEQDILDYIRGYHNPSTPPIEIDGL